jgi:hypothetical protein
VVLIPELAHSSTALAGQGEISVWASPGPTLTGRDVPRTPNPVTGLLLSSAGQPWDLLPRHCKNVSRAVLNLGSGRGTGDPWLPCPCPAVVIGWVDASASGPFSGLWPSCAHGRH